MSKVLILGAGVGGMACAARLAVKGHQVQVLEQNPTYGGMVTEFDHAGTKFQLGPNLLHFPAVYRDLFLKTGKPLEDSIELRESDETFYYRFPDGTSVTLPGQGVGKSAEAIGDALGGSSADQWRRFIRRGSEMWSKVRKPLFEAEQSGYRGAAPLLLNPKSFRTISPLHSLRDIANQYLTDPRLISITDRYALEIGSDPRKASATLATQPYLEQTLGAYQVVGGMTKLSQALYERCLALGVEFKFKTKVEKIFGQKEIERVESANGESFTADLFVTNFNSQTLNTNSNRYQDRALGLSVLTFLLETNKSIDDLALTKYYLPKDSNEELDALFKATKSDNKRANYSIKVTRSDSKSDGSALQIQTPVAPLSVESRAQWSSDDFVSNIKSQILETLTQSGLSLDGSITWEQALTPLDVESRTGTRNGSCYPLTDTGLHSRFAYPPNSTPANNLFVVGAHCHPGGGLPQVAISAELLAERIGRAD